MSGIIDTPVGHELVATIRDNISDFGIDDDLNDVAQYITLMVSNNKPVDELVQELTGLFSPKFDQNFCQWVYEELERAKSRAAGQAPGIPSDNSAPAPVKEESGFGGFVEDSSRAPPPRGPRRFTDRAGAGARPSGGITKQPRGERRLGGYRVGSGPNANNKLQNVAQDMMMVDGGERGSNGIDLSGGLGDRRERCRHWPKCNYPNCRHPHPRKPCRAFENGNCTRPQGTCPFLHMGEDPIVAPDGRVYPPSAAADASWVNGVLVVDNSRRRRNNNHHQNQQQELQEPSIMLCRYSDRCANKQCLFGHATPANPSGKVTVLEWCPEKQECQNAACEMAHPSASLVRAPEPIPDRVLETCKFLDGCMNPKCRYRHPRSPIMCRSGADCQRLDCFFTHPLKETCKYAANCTNVQCLYQHPPEREEILKRGQRSFQWVKGQDDQGEESTSERQFAAEDSEKMVVEASS
ncbi:hypothetical protein TRVA0_048S00584 [Trichomonascus vanleenenianus]|uniref:mRNA-binding protein NAB2 n=1 Tax=Trichomonascus vanleenenianus TaxID=2268995 RepID=UPI003EC9755D